MQYTLVHECAITMNNIRQFIISAALILTVTSLSAQEASVQRYSSNNKTVIKNRNGFSSFDVETRGKIVLTDDDKDVKSMSPDGYLEVRKTVFGSRRTLIISVESNGLKKEYYEGRTKVPFEPAGRQWMAEILPELVRTTTIGAEGRVDRFFKKGGASAVVNEIESMESNYVKSHYANLLMKQKVSSNEYARIIDRIAGTVDSNYYLAGFLKNNLDTFLQSNDALVAVFRATSKLDSDHYKTEVIKTGLGSKDVSIDAVKIILKSAGSMDSDHYKTEVLTSLLKQNNLTDEVLSEMFVASKTIDSDYYRSVVLNRALNRDGLSATSFQRALESVKDIDSDHYKSEVLTSLLNKPISQDLQINLIGLTNSIESDHYCTQVLEEVLSRQDVNDQVFVHLIQRAGSIESDHYSSTVMREALTKNLSDANLIILLKSAGRINSDHYLTEVLVAAAPKVRRAGSNVKDAFNDAAKNIGSETYYGRAMRALNDN